MTDVALIYPHQLFTDHPLLHRDRLHVLIEDPLFFGDPQYPARFHKLKLILHRAALKRYEREVLAARGYRTLYLERAQVVTVGHLFEHLQQADVSHLHAVEPSDFMLEKRLKREARRRQIPLIWYDSPNFLNTRHELDAYFNGRDAYQQTDFYIHQRKRLNLLLDDEGGPVGGRWTYDTENRRKLPKQIALPAAPPNRDNAYIHEARAYVEAHFPHNPGASDAFIYPTNAAEAQAVLQGFLDEKLGQFGPYQDAITPRGDFLFHSLLSAPLNAGLLTPRQIIDATLNHPAVREGHAPLASVEGFLRQIVGWREFMRAVYLRAGVTQRTRNFFNHERRLHPHWYAGQTTICPVDDVIAKVQRHAYAHHIERLMLAGNLMLLSEIHPDAVYRWFMEMFIDAYDWVMVPNVYGMSQYADGGLITTKPYISSSNYIRKMSDYPKANWMLTWDGLYWRFIDKHRDFFGQNPRLAVMTSHLKRMSADRLRAHHDNAEAFLQRMN